jgi:hypothetical protein
VEPGSTPEADDVGKRKEGEKRKKKRKKPSKRPPFVHSLAPFAVGLSLPLLAPFCTCILAAWPLRIFFFLLQTVSN